MSPPLSVEIAGDGPPDIVLVPGLGDPKEAWSRVAPLLAARSARVVMVDDPGVGGSSAAGAPATTAAMAGPVAAAVAQVAGGRPVHLVGHSMGGMVAQEVALARAELVSGLIPADRTAELAALIPGARSVAVPGGHACFWERPEGLAAAIAAAAGL